MSEKMEAVRSSTFREAKAKEEKDRSTSGSKIFNITAS